MAPYSWAVTAGTAPGGLTLNTSTGAISGVPTSSVGSPFSFSITATDSVGATSAAQSFSVAIAPQPHPSISLTSPANGASVWGAFELTGYAYENTPALLHNTISVGVLIASNDDTGFTLSGPATYGVAPPTNICGTAPYPDGTNCPNAGFVYTWNTGSLNGAGGTFYTNGSYTATLTASDSSSPPLTTATSATVTVDNQAPSPTIVSPVNGNGAYGVEQVFTVSYLSPHATNDFGWGQVLFIGPSSTA